MAGVDLRITCDGPTGKDCRIWLDGKELTHYCHGAEIDLGVRDANKVTLHLFVDHLDLGFNGDVEVVTPILRRDVA